MRKLIFLLFHITFWVQAQEKVAAKIDSVNLYPSGAQVFKSLTVDLKEGENSFFINGMSNEVLLSTVAFDLKDVNLSLSNIDLQPANIGDPEYAKTENLTSRKNEQLLTQIQKIYLDLSVLKKQEVFLLENQKVGGLYAGLKPEDLKEAASYFKTEIQGILYKTYLLEGKVDSIKKEIQKNNIVLNNVGSQKDRQLSVLSFSIYSSTTKVNHTLVISYFTKNAGWLPEYDLKAVDVTKPIQLNYKAKAYQYTGEDWENVVLTLNSLNPTQESTAPMLKPWYWGTVNYYTENNIEDAAFKKNTLQGRIITREGEALPGANVIIKGTSLGVTTDVNGYYNLTIPLNMQDQEKTILVTFIGFKNLEKKLNQIQAVEILEEDTNTLDEVVVTGYAAPQKRSVRGAATVLSGRVPGVSASSNIKTKRELVLEEDAPTQSTFTLKQKQTMPSSGKTKSMELKEVEVQTGFTYVSVPKVSPKAFLQAEIVNWEDLKLLPGEINLYFEGRFVGKTDLDLSNKDTLILSLGRDESIFIERKEVKSMRKKSFLSGNYTQSKIFEIDLRNTKAEEVRVLVKDQYPLSQNKEISILEKEAIGAVENTDTGELIWDLKLKPKERKSLLLKYTVKYPKSGTVYE